MKHQNLKVKWSDIFKIFFSAWIIQNIEHETSISIESPKLSLTEKKKKFATIINLGTH